MSAKVNLTKRIPTSSGLRFCPVVMAGNGRVKPGWVIVNGQEQHHPTGSYFIDWTEGGRRRRTSVGKDATVALNKKLKKETELLAVSQGIALAPSQAGGTNLTTAISEYLEEIRLTDHKQKTLAAYRVATRYFLECCPKEYVEQIERADMLKFSDHLRRKGLAPRTVYNKFENITFFLKRHKKNDILLKNDWPKFVEELPRIYEPEELDALYAISESDEALWWDFFLMTGMREQEVMYCAWENVRPAQGVIEMKWKPYYNWTPKAYKEREIPVPDGLFAKLERVRGKHGRRELVFPTASGKPKFDFLDCVKACAIRAKQPTEEFYLHKFRATFATTHLRNGQDLRTVQSWMGHVDIESTMRYLRPARNEMVRDSVNSAFPGRF